MKKFGIGVRPMSADQLILCGRVKPPTRDKRWASAPVHKLSLGPGPNQIHLDVEAIPQALAATLTDAALDLAELAAFVFTADQCCGRGGLREFEYGAKWRRHFRVEVPVRNPEHWRSIRGSLQEALGFLTDDDWDFHFHQNSSPAPATRYFQFSRENGNAGRIDGVQLFSGGLDSFGGAVREILQGERRVALVSHVSTEKIGKPQRDLVDYVRKAANPGTPQPLHIQVRLNKGKGLGREDSQRSRSFIFAAFAAIVAQATGQDRVRVFENGIVSFNLPTSMQVLGGRASRTTHPRSLQLLGAFLGAALRSPLVIENPFLWKTKADVLLEIAGSGHAVLCKHTISCAHTLNRTRQHSHCGRCSQCVDRRFVMRAAGYAADEDPPEMYESTLTSPLTDARDITTVERYIGTALRIRDMPDASAFLSEYGEVSRTLRSLGLKPAESLIRVFALHKRHADQVLAASGSFIESMSGAIAAWKVPATSPLGIAGNLGRPGELRGVPEAATHSDKLACPLSIDEATFTVWSYGHSCQLHNTVEFRLIQALASKQGQYVTHARLFDLAWGPDVVRQLGTLHKTASNVRRKLREAGITDVVIDGKNRGHLALIFQGSVRDASHER